MTYPVCPFRNFSCASPKVASMAEANDSELGQEKQKGKNPVVENDPIGVGLPDGDVDEGGEGVDKKNKDPVVEDGFPDGGDVNEGGEGIVDGKNKNPVVEDGLSDGDVDEGGEGVVDRRGGEVRGDYPMFLTFFIKLEVKVVLINFISLASNSKGGFTLLDFVRKMVVMEGGRRVIMVVAVWANFVGRMWGRKCVVWGEFF